MTFFGLSERDAETSRDTNGLNELSYRPAAGGKLMQGFYGLSFRLMMIASLAEVIVQLIGLISTEDYSADFKKALLLLGAAVLAGASETVLRYRSELVLNRHCGNSSGGRYTVFREKGKTETVPENMLAVGDKVFLSEGDKVPADGTLIDGTLIAECSAFGVIGKAEKTASAEGKTAVRKLSDPSFLAGGSTVCYGSGTIKITAVGTRTLIAEKNGAKPVHLHEGKFAKAAFTGFAAASAAAALSLICNAVLGTLGESLSAGFASGLVRGICSAAAAMSAACFCGKNLYCETAAASAVKRLEKRSAGISDPDVLNTASETDIIFTDRAGMIAENEYTDSKTIFIDGNGTEFGNFPSVGGKLSETLETAILAASQAVMTGKGEALGGSELDRALLRFVSIEENAAGKINKQAEVRPEGDELISGATILVDGKPCTFIRGGAEIILGKCSDSLSENGIKQKITNKNALIKLAETISLTGKDVVALALSDRPVKGGRLPTGGCTLIGLIALRDNILDGAEEEVKRLRKNDVRTILVTDKSRGAAIYAVKHAGIKKSGGIILNSEQLAQMSDKELSARLKDIKAIVRALPADRRRLIRAAHDAGLTVCASASDAGTAKAVSDADWILASPNCKTAAKASADASSGQCGIKSAADIISQAERYFSGCRLWIALRLAVSAVLAAVLIFF